jgi:predicted Ser/Thr protein kinase
MAPFPDGSPVTVGSDIGPYRLERLLGRGGMGEVFLTHDRRHSRTVALKLLHHHALVSPVLRERLRREGELASALRHPNICEIYQVGEVDGRPFIAMEYVEGAPLEELIGERSFSVRDVVTIGWQLADALDLAREHGIVHRDLGTPNILLTPEGCAKILDFGLACTMEGRTVTPDRRSRLTDPGVVLGTVEYMSPEQALGEAVDHRSDLFSLGVVLFELLTGRLPFDGRTKMERIWMITNRDPHAIRVTAGSALAELAAILRRLLQKDPRKRYQTAGDLRADLGRLRLRLSQKRKAPLSLLLRPIVGLAAGMAFAFGGLAPATFWLSLTAEAAYHADVDRRSSIWMGTLRDEHFRPLGSAPINATSMWVGDGGDLVYATTSTLGTSSVWRVPAGTTKPVLVVNEASRPSVTPNGRVVVFTGDAGRRGLFRVNTDGSSLVALAGGDATDARVTPDGESVIFTATSGGRRTLHRIALGGGAITDLGSEAVDSRAVISPDGRRAAFESGGRVIVCELPDCTATTVVLMAHPRAWTSDSRGLTYVSRPGQANVWVAPVDGGMPRQITHFANQMITTLAISPDGRRMAITRQRPFSDLTLAAIFR